MALWHRIVRGHERATFALLDDLGLSVTQVKTLHALDHCVEAVSVGDVSEELGISQAAASRTIEGLLRRGWVERREDPSDRRMKRVSITAAGREVAGRLTDARLQGLEAFAASLSPEQRAGLHTALAALDHPEHEG